MAISFSHFHLSPSKITSPKSNHPNIPLHITSKPTIVFTKNTPKFTQFASRPHNFTTTTIIPKASQEEENTITNGNTENPPAETQQENSQSDELKDLGLEIKKAMKEREQKEGGFFSGVAEEIREIEWPSFNKVLGTTGVVLGVIAGSSVVLLTVNAVLAELSDRVFAGKGIQDFFG
ncbi:hypothetical protein ACJIZ3_013878 [Penstemon smallii]|uniref:Preprotein translocase subunit SECE1 n=1 Tax=Penstemon smallii TaxID=265156 RepID=A0ABD3RUB0_9LAMI